MGSFIFCQKQCRDWLAWLSVMTFESFAPNSVLLERGRITWILNSAKILLLNKEKNIVLDISNKWSYWLSYTFWAIFKSHSDPFPPVENTSFLDAHCQKQWASLGVKFFWKIRTQSVDAHCHRHCRKDLRIINVCIKFPLHSWCLWSIIGFLSFLASSDFFPLLWVKPNKNMRKQREPI